MMPQCIGRPNSNDSLALVYSDVEQPGTGCHHHCTRGLAGTRQDVMDQAYGEILTSTRVPATVALLVLMLRTSVPQ